jgi:enoyl-CoA hydratase/carnithine racemase
LNRPEIGALKVIDLKRQDDIFTLTMNAGENRWNTGMVRKFARALDDVEASTGAAALITRASDEKFFSNGLDLAWYSAPADYPEGGDTRVFAAEFMALMGRIITLPVPTVCAINGHAFGAGFMLALCHDVRIMRADRGYLCANEIQLGMAIPTAELALFRHKLPANVFFETVQLGRRWSGPQALDAGIVAQVAGLDDLSKVTLQRAQDLAPLGANRALYGGQKERLFGDNAAINSPHGAAHLLKNASHP